MTNINVIQISNLKFYEGKLCSKDIVLIKNRIGKVNAAISTTLLISQFKVEKIIFTGVARAVNPEIKVTDIVIEIGVKSKDYVYKNYFYQRAYVGKKTLKIDINNDKLPIMEVL